MAKSWLDVQVGLELAPFQPGGHEQLKSCGGAIETSPGSRRPNFSYSSTASGSLCSSSEAPFP
uniref:Uncharacterized protein n=1 Tax=Nelumbo nucifera TaxID=4432 RepID=A0A822ZI80_NELNU|nr:TPA_asm: hypothetical protein HUJ06_002480 [Nelumbo nucifera]